MPARDGGMSARVLKHTHIHAPSLPPPLTLKQPLGQVGLLELAQLGMPLLHQRLALQDQGPKQDAPLAQVLGVLVHLRGNPLPYPCHPPVSHQRVKQRGRGKALRRVSAPFSHTQPPTRLLLLRDGQEGALVLLGNVARPSLDPGHQVLDLLCLPRACGRG
jgi:hypothetical protein